MWRLFVLRCMGQDYERADGTGDDGERTCNVICILYYSSALHGSIASWERLLLLACLACCTFAFKMGL